MLKRPVTTIRARKRGTTRFLIGSTPSTWSASSSSRILRAPRSAVIAVPPTPARMIAVTNGANSRIEASTKKPPRRSIAPNRTRKLPAWSPGAPYPNAIVEIVSGSQQSRSMNRNCCTNSVPYGYGGRIADTSVLPVRIIMSPTCSSRLLVGRKIRSAAALTTKQSPPSGDEAYGMFLPLARANKPRSGLLCRPRTERVVCSPDLEARTKRTVRIRPSRMLRPCTLACLIAVTGCGGAERQDENEPEGNFAVEGMDASFPDQQQLAQSTTLSIMVRNAGDETVPNIAVTVAGLDYRATQPAVANPERPQFAINALPREIGGFPEAKDAAPDGCDTAYVNTWACGPLK